MINQEELWAFNIINNNTQNVQAELQRAVSARDAYIKLLEIKYDAVFENGELKPKKKTKEK